MTPTEELALEVLAARFRLGEQVWTFRSRHAPMLRKLEVDELIFTMHGITEGTIRAGLTAKGKEQTLFNGYQPPRSEGPDRAVATPASGGEAGPGSEEGAA